jgi:hypothetical protein
MCVHTSSPTHTISFQAKDMKIEVETTGLSSDDISARAFLSKLERLSITLTALEAG